MSFLKSEVSAGSRPTSPPNLKSPHAVITKLVIYSTKRMKIMFVILSRVHHCCVGWYPTPWNILHPFSVLLTTYLCSLLGSGTMFVFHTICQSTVYSLPELITDISTNFCNCGEISPPFSTKSVSLTPFRFGHYIYHGNLYLRQNLALLFSF